jgi:hypothetical protein
MKRVLGLTLQRREKIAFLAGGAVAAILAGYSLFSWYGDLSVSTDERAETKRAYLVKQMGRIAGKKDLVEKVEAAKGALKDLERGLLPGAKPPVAAAELQRVLKEMAVSAGIEIKTERAVSPVDLERYSGIPVEIGFTATTAKLKDLLQRIETAPYLLRIPELRVRVMNVQQPQEVSVTMTVRGVIKKGARESA